MMERRSPYIIKPYTLMNYKNGTWTEANKRATRCLWKIKVTSSRATHAFLAILHRKWCSFDVMTSFRLTVRGGQVHVRPNKVKFSNQYFCIRRTCFWLRISSGFQICIVFFCDAYSCQRLQVKKWRDTFSIIKCSKNAKIYIFFNVQRVYFHLVFQHIFRFFPFFSKFRIL